MNVSLNLTAGECDELSAIAAEMQCSSIQNFFEVLTIYVLETTRERRQFLDGEFKGMMN